MPSAADTAWADPTRPASPVATGPFLVIEASSAAGSVALLSVGTPGAPHPLLGAASVAMGASRVDTLTPAVEAVLEAARVTPAQLGGVVCGAGPGSFTSLRIAASLAKGLAFGTGCALFAVPSLLFAVPRSPDGAPLPGTWLVTSDALRGEVFAQVVAVDAAGRPQARGEAIRGVPDALPSALRALPRRHVSLDEGITPSAEVARWIQEWTPWGPRDVDAWEPSYGRLAEAQVQWEARHGGPLPVP